MRVSSQRVRPIDVMHLGNEHVICCWEVDGWLVDPGPQSCEETLLAAIGGERPKGLLLTHIHFDHAGAAGALVRRWPDLPVYVHERGAPHLADPGQARRLRRPAVRRHRGPQPAVGRGRARPRGEPEDPRGGRERRSRAPSPSSTRPATPPTTSATCTSRAAWPSSATWPACASRPTPSRSRPTPPPDIDVEKWEALARHDRRLGAEGARPHPLGPGRRPARAARARAREPQRAGRVRRAARRGRLRRGLLGAASTRTPARPPTRSSRRRPPTSFSWASSVI